ncbi:MAG: GntR family transcriptional regulator [Candidatus Omnitrophica bacterium]|jgi:LacI family transcriptional regulator|nr:GntR family transcriptional regulator [Candidatus Omnitrophota bacterium]
MKDSVEKNSSVPLYKQLKRVIENQVKSGEKKPGELVSSEKEFCEKHGISQITVRKAIFELVNEGVLYRIPGKGTFVSGPEQGSRSASKLKTDNIGFVISREHHPIFSNTFYSYVFAGVEEEARAHGYNLIYQVLDEKLMFDPSTFKLIEERKVDGLILTGEMSHSFVSNLKSKDIPIVLVDHLIEDSGLDSVVTDNTKGTSEMIKYLADLGHEHIGFLGATLEHGSFMERFEGYKAALKKNHLEFKEDFVQTGLLWNGYGMMEKMFRLPKMPTAIFACNDLMAVRAMAAIQDKGMKVPDDMSIAGFDDIDMSQQIHPPLTTVRVQKEEMGKAGVKRLIQRIKNSNKRPEKIVVPTELVVRKSCKALK